MQHPTFLLSVENSTAQIILTPCPGRKQVKVDDALQQLKSAGAEAILTLMTDMELLALSIPRVGESVAALGMQWFHLPIEDDSHPDDSFNAEWEKVGPTLHRLLDDGKSIAIHCKGGSGRTGLVAGKLLLERGELLQSVITRIQTLRPNAFTLPLQLNYMNQLHALNTLHK